MLQERQLNRGGKSGGIGGKRLTRKDLSTGAISGASKAYGGKTGKLREVRVAAHFTAADRPTSIIHNLGFVPTKYTTVNMQSQTTGTPGNIYGDFPLQADTRRIVLKCTTGPTTATLIIS
jgi:hypothetical protein